MESEILKRNENYIPPKGRSFFIRVPNFWGSISDLTDLNDNIELNDLRKTVSISTAVIPSRKSDVRILIGPKLYSTVVLSHM